MPAGYSGTPLLKKLGIKPDTQLLWVDAPSQYTDLLGPLPKDIQFLTEEGKEQADFIHVFMLRKDQLANQLLRLKPRLKKEGMIWISWPKQRSSISTDLNRETIREAGLETGLVDVKVCAIDADWSGLKFVYRKKDR
ncbi:MAG: DUF3052 family protein [Bacteroidota bacterium]